MLQLSCICLPQLGIHVAHVVGDYFSKHGCTLLFRTEFHYLFLRFGKGYADTPQGGSLALHRLSQQVSDIPGILLSVVHSFLLGYEVVHCRNKSVERSLLVQKSCNLLCSHALHCPADNAELRLDTDNLVHLLNILVGGIHALAHNRGQKGVRLLYGVIAGGKTSHDIAEIVDGRGHVLNNCRGLVECNKFVAKLPRRTLCLVERLTKFFYIRSNDSYSFLTVNIDFYVKLYIFRHFCYDLFVY